MPADLQDLLANGEVEAFNAERPQGKLDLYAADLSGIQAPGVDLSGANLENADLSGAVLSDGMLARASLEGADCTGAKMDGVMALKSRWRGAFLGEADLSGAELTPPSCPTPSCVAKSNTVEIPTSFSALAVCSVTPRRT